MSMSREAILKVISWALVGSATAACREPDLETDAGEILAAAQEDRASPAGLRGEPAEFGPVESVAHGDHAVPGAERRVGGQETAGPGRRPRTDAEILAVHRDLLRSTLAGSPVRLELPAGSRWRFVAAPGTHAGAFFETTAAPLAACGADGPVLVRVPYNSELELAAGASQTLLILGRTGPDGVEATLTTPWDGHSVVSPRSAAPVPLTRAEVFGDCA